jgi:hypothetical protein
MRSRLIGVGDDGVVVRVRGAGARLVPFGEILTAERARSGRGIDLHVRGTLEPIRVRCRRSKLRHVEDSLRFVGIRIVDCWGAIIAPTLLDFEEELAREPVRVGQSSDIA